MLEIKHKYRIGSWLYKIISHPETFKPLIIGGYQEIFIAGIIKNHYESSNPYYIVDEDYAGSDLLDLYDCNPTLENIINKSNIVSEDMILDKFEDIKLIFSKTHEHPFNDVYFTETAIAEYFKQVFKDV